MRKRTLQPARLSALAEGCAVTGSLTIASAALARPGTPAGGSSVGMNRGETDRSTGDPHWGACIDLLPIRQFAWAQQRLAVPGLRQAPDAARKSGSACSRKQWRTHFSSDMTSTCRLDLACLTGMRPGAGGFPVDKQTWNLDTDSSSQLIPTHILPQLTTLAADCVFVRPAGGRLAGAPRCKPSRLRTRAICRGAGICFGSTAG